MMEFQKWIRQGPGRCQECGFHPATQGHGEDCSKTRGKS